MSLAPGAAASGLEWAEVDELSDEDVDLLLPIFQQFADAAASQQGLQGEAAEIFAHAWTAKNKTAVLDQSLVRARAHVHGWISSYQLKNTDNDNVYWRDLCTLWMRAALDTFPYTFPY